MPTQPESGVIRILVADEAAGDLQLMRDLLANSGYEVVVAASGNQAMKQLRGTRCDLCICSIQLPGVDGARLIDRIATVQPDAKVLLTADAAVVAQAVRAVKRGAFDYIKKPLQEDEFCAAVDRAVNYHQLERENRRLKGRLTRREYKLIGLSEPFRAMMGRVEQAARTDGPVLLIGPEGTGKELVARAIHSRGKRGGGEFQAVNCDASPEDRLEAELFGQVQGAQDGISDQRGKFETANGGTIFLDEIGDLSLPLQEKLLRVLQSGDVTAMGSDHGRKVDTRVIAATSKDLRDLCADGHFRKDLMDHLHELIILVPSLAERRDDIPLLARVFADRVAAGADVTISPRLIEALEEYDWPGNVRELENLMERMVLLRTGNELTPADLPEEFGQDAGS